MDKKTSPTSFMAQISVWLTPILLMISGYFVKKEFDTIHDQLQMVMAIQLEQASQKGAMNTLDYRVTRLEQSVYASKDKTLSALDTKLVAKHEEIFHLDDLNHQTTKSD